MKNSDHVINLVLSARRILSVNSIYAARLIYKGAKPSATIYKTGDAKRIEEYIKEQITSLNIPVNFPWINKNTMFRMTIKVVFSSGFLLRDLDNTIKLLQDGIFRGLDINDSHVVHITADKVLFPGINEEKIYVSLQECDERDYRLDLTPLPENIWFGTEEKLEFDPIPKRRKKDVRYFMETEKSCSDTLVYILSPAIKFTPGLNADILQDLDKTILSDTGFIYLGILGNKDTWGENWPVIEELVRRFDGSLCNRAKSLYIENKEELIKIL